MMTDKDCSDEFAKFFINEILPRRKKTGVSLSRDEVASLFILMYDNIWPRTLVRKILDFKSGIVSKNSTLEDDQKKIFEMVNAQNSGVQIITQDVTI